jgi:hypothetical protein
MRIVLKVYFKKKLWSTIPRGSLETATKVKMSLRPPVMDTYVKEKEIAL